jgi:hypothetical protein
MPTYAPINEHTFGSPSLSAYLQCLFPKHTNFILEPDDDSSFLFIFDVSAPTHPWRGSGLLHATGPTTLPTVQSYPNWYLNIKFAIASSKVSAPPNHHPSS